MGETLGVGPNTMLGEVGRSTGEMATVEAAAMG